ncbi:MAG: hypothetical protein JWM44_2306 [Bacilli bacterium]|nr:hypothetical protein [Bacilli bacterium]
MSNKLIAALLQIKNYQIPSYRTHLDVIQILQDIAEDALNEAYEPCCEYQKVIEGRCISCAKKLERLIDLD